MRAQQYSLAQIARTFDVSELTVDKGTKRWRETDRAAALPWAGGLKGSLPDCAAVIKAEARKQPDVTLAELCERVELTTGVRSKRSMTSRELRRLGLPRKEGRSATARGTRRG